jgi:hypothetical protein
MTKRSKRLKQTESKHLSSSAIRTFDNSTVVCRLCLTTQGKFLSEYNAHLIRVADPDPEYFGKLDPDPHWNEKLDPNPYLSQISGYSALHT